MFEIKDKRIIMGLFTNTVLKVIDMMVKAKILSSINTAKLKYLYKMKKWPNFEHPRDINEKINWLKFYGDSSRWGELADKYAVRQYTEQIGLGHTLVKLYGKWDKAEDIDWDSLPNQFVLKGNAGSGDIVICKDKSNLDKEKVTKYFAGILQETFGRLSGEPHYAKIKPCIIAEELLDSTNQPCNSTSIVDYKIWCFDGKPLYIMCCYNRHKYHATVGMYDSNWKYHPEWSVFTSHYVEGKEMLPRPVCLDFMLSVAAQMSKGFPQVRIDLYEVKGHVYFGEYTFTSQGGAMDYFTPEFLLQMGNDCHLPCDK